MKINRFLCIAASAACSITIATPALADIIQYSYTGHVRDGDGFDATGVFGNVYSLGGFAYTATYTIDTSRGALTNDGVTYDLRGGSFDGNTSPNLFTQFTVNGHSFSFTGDYLGSSYLYDNTVNSAVSTGAEYLYSDPASSASIKYLIANTVALPSTYLPYSLITPGTWSFPGSCGWNTGCGGSVRISNVDSQGNVVALSELNLIPETFTITASVPEPETYAMMIAGLGLMGFMARRRKLLAV